MSLLSTYWSSDIGHFWCLCFHTAQHVSLHLHPSEQKPSFTLCISIAPVGEAWNNLHILLPVFTLIFLYPTRCFYMLTTILNSPALISVTMSLPICLPVVVPHPEETVCGFNITRANHEIHCQLPDNWWGISGIPRS